MDTDERFAAVADRLVDEPGVSPPGADGGRGFGSGALKVDGSVFAMTVQGALVLKLPEARVADLLSTGACAPFASSGGRSMREWAVVMPADPAADLGLAREALAHVRSLRRTARR